MRLDHLLSKDRFVGVASWLFVCLGCSWSGAAGGLLPRGTAWCPVALACVVGVGVVGCRRGVGSTPAAAWCGGGGCPRAFVWGWHAVGVLGRCALVAWPVSCCLFVGWWGVGVGGLVVNCIVDASIFTVGFLRQVFCRVFCCLFS